MTLTGFGNANVDLASLRVAREEIDYIMQSATKLGYSMRVSLAWPPSNDNLAASEESEVERKQAWTKQRHCYSQNNDNRRRKRPLQEDGRRYGRGGESPACGS
jgi:hypothetical protein